MVKTKKELKYQQVDPEKIKMAMNEVNQALDLISVLTPDIIDTEVKQFGNSGHIVLPKEYVGKKAKVIIKK